VRIPRVRERVRIDGRDGLFLVVWVDHERELADLIPLADSRALEENIPFHSIRPLAEDSL
jgi:hypothetical protein